MPHPEQLTLPGFTTVKRLRQRHGLLLLLEFDLLLWREHQAVLDRRGEALPRLPNARDKAARQAWFQLAEKIRVQPVPAIKPIRVWELGHFNGAGVLPWLQGKREPLTTEEVDQLRKYLEQGRSQETKA
jgi:hypothetical protein